MSSSSSWSKVDIDEEKESWDCGGTSHLLSLERSQASFDVEKLTHHLDGGEKQTMRRRWIQNSSKESTVLKGMHSMNRADLTASSLKHFLDIHMKHIKNGFQPRRGDVNIMSSSAISSSPLMPHYSLFISTLAGQASPEQAAVWLPMAYQLEIIGSYAQTELGHGSNVRGLKTVAEYDQSTEQFVLNTPTLQSMKWWNSNAGLFATHCTLYAQLVINGQEKGVHVFMVQLRDENHNLLPGIECGDVGSKLADNAIDTGYIRLSNVRIPRQHLLAKRQHVEADGTYVRHSSKSNNSSGKMHYLTMMGARSGMVGGAADTLSAAATIAVRFSAVRHQGFKSDGSYKGEEHAILDYKYQQYRLFQHLSYAYASKFTGKWIRVKMGQVSEDVDASVDDLPELHASSAGLKGLITKQAHDGMEDLRKCCGGHGFLSSSGIAPLTTSYAWKVTAEGDWVVLLLQTARYLVKSIRAARAGARLSGLCQIYEPLKDPRYKGPAKLPIDSINFEDVHSLLSLFKERAILVALDAEAKLEEEQQSGLSGQEAWNNCAILLVEMAICHCEYFMLDKFIYNTAACEDVACREVLEKVCVMFALSRINSGIQWGGMFSRSQIQALKSSINNTLGVLRPNAVTLVDAFDIPDHILNSTIGSSDGKIYERLFEDAKNNPLNSGGILKGYDFVKEYLNSDVLKLHNKLYPELAKL